MNQALLIIDAQCELIEGNHTEKEVVNKAVLLSTIQKTIKKANEAGAEVIYIRDLDVADGKGQGFDIHPEIPVHEGAAVFNKQATNAFYGTPLLEHLKEKQIYHLVIMGCKTEHCIDTAVRTATVSGMDVTLVKDGHSTTDSAVLTGEQIVAHHNEILHGHYNVDHFSIVREAEEDLFRPMHDQYRADEAE
ncbi:isochorismatase family protein [Bacillus mangrovi]|uniref:Isochorismatase family protein n=1 Tax=Metabacillus mangrovi TaxID=1491830 RepID=A0A7X2S5M2_9BACI|nr:isochorismatase family protein [Metabacillus mangrovi]MTH53680.1 isochorismatase family protein [Metabacillus mangrovi]